MNWVTNLCPPQQTMPGILQSFSNLSDESLGTVTINELSPQVTTRIDLGPDPLTVIFGPGADPALPGGGSLFPCRSPRRVTATARFGTEPG